MGKHMPLVTILILLSISLGCSRVARVTGVQDKDMPSVTVGQGKLGFVHFPGDFTRKVKKLKEDTDDTRYLVTTLEYEVRKSSGSNELIFAMTDHLDEKLRPGMSDDFYAVTLDGQFKTRKGTIEEWKNAKVLTSMRQDDAVIGSPVKGDKEGGVTYDDKHYPLQPGCTPTETRSFLSPGKKWLVVMSDDSKPANRPGIPGFSGGGRTDGHLFIDIYDTKSGEKILAAKASHDGCPGCLFSNSIWVGDNYFVVPLDPPGEDRSSVGQDCFLAILTP